ncbi:MAG: hypothetical protein ACK5LP_02565 [Campylobacteraceae bacterium]
MAKAKKSKIQNYSYPSIVTIDPATMTSFRYDWKEAKVNDINKSAKKSDFFISYISAKEAISGTIELSKSIEESEVRDALEIKTYEDLGLDTSINYKINYLEITKKTDSQSDTLYSVFAINSDAMAQSLNTVAKKVNYIDYITTVPFLIGSLYKKNIIQSYGNECFIYFQKNDAFLAIYKDGEYLYSKSLRYSLSEINEKFCTLLGERVDEEKFFEMLQKEGLRSSNMNYQQQFMKLFGEIFLYINDIAVFARRSCGINQLDKVYVGTDIGIINGMGEYVRSYMGVEANDFDFGITPDSKNKNMSQIHVMLTLTAQLYLEGGSIDDALNFTIYRRPPPLNQRPAGKFIGVVAIAIIASLIWPTIQYVQGLYKSVLLAKEQNTLRDIEPKAINLKNELNILNNDFTSKKKTYDTESNILISREGLLNEIRNKRINYIMKAATITDLIKMVNGNDVKIEKIYQENQNIILSLVGSNEKKFTELMDEVAKSGKYSIRTKEIYKDVNTSTIYKSDIKMEVL